MTLQEKLLDRSRRSKYNKIVKQMNKAADNGAQEINVIATNFDEYTEQLFKSDGLIIEEVNYLGYKAFKLSWYGKA